MANGEPKDSSDASDEEDRERQDPSADPELDEGPDESVHNENAEGNTPSSKKKNLPRIPGKHAFRRWLLPAALYGVMIVIMGFGIKFGLNWLDSQEPLPSDNASNKLLNRGLHEQALSPFFIPLPGSSSKEVIKIDLAIIWDGITSVRFDKNRLKIRDYLYRHMIDLAKKHKNLQEKTTFLETEIGKIVQESLMISDFSVRIKKITYF